MSTISNRPKFRDTPSKSGGVIDMSDNKSKKRPPEILGKNITPLPSHIIDDSDMSGCDKSICESNTELIEELVRTKVDKVEGKGLSSNDFTDADKEKLDNLTPVDPYVLPIASDVRLGGIKIGNGIIINEQGTVSLDNLILECGTSTEVVF